VLVTYLVFSRGFGVVWEEKNPYRHMGCFWMSPGRPVGVLILVVKG
jgi:hypothetical protein